MKDLFNCVSGDPGFVALWHDVCADADRAEAAFIQDLRRRGFKAAHPNDGWVNRERMEVYLSYPQFNDGAKVGDLIMLGSVYDKEERLRPVRLTGKRETVLGKMVWWQFVDEKA